MKEVAALPGYLKPFFWESALSQIHPRRHWFYIIERLIEYGDDRAIHWLKENYTCEQIAEVVRTSRAISRNTANFWALVLKIPRGKIRCFSEPSLLPHGAFSRESPKLRIAFLRKNSGRTEIGGGRKVKMIDDQLEFLKSEFFTLTLEGTVQRTRVYAEGAGNQAKWRFQADLQRELKHLASRYGNAVAEEEHIRNIEELSKVLSKKHCHTLKNGRFRIGTAQKALNLYLKYLWCLGEIPPPPHCPFDYWIIQDVLGLGMKWTSLDDIAEYRRLVEAARNEAKAQGLSLPEWELKVYSGI